MKGKFTKTAIQEILRNAGLDSLKAREATARVVEAMAAALAAGEVVELRGLGTFEPRERKARVMRNPRTGSSVNVPDRLAIFFRPSGKLKEALNAKKEASM